MADTAASDVSVEPTEPPEAFRRIELEEIDVNIFRASETALWRPRFARGVFGGQVIGQALAAATRTVKPSFQLHSLHCYFVRRGDDTKDIIYTVMRVRDGRSFVTRHVAAQQRGRIVFVLIASFQGVEGFSKSHARPMPVVPPPTEIMTESEFGQRLSKDPRLSEMEQKGYGFRYKSAHLNPIDMRHCSDYEERLAHLALIDKTPQRSQRIWLRSRDRLPDDPNIHRAVLAYASDFQLLGTARLGIGYPEIAMMASLDHSMWFHAPFRADEWLLYDMTSPRTANSRGLSFGHIYKQDGTLAVTVAQEGLIRLRVDRPPAIKDRSIAEHKTAADRDANGSNNALERKHDAASFVWRSKL